MAKKNLPPDLIIETVANDSDLSVSELKGYKLKKPVVLARHIAMYLIRQNTSCSLEDIGKRLGDRVPATVSHAYQRISRLIENEASIKEKVLNIQLKLNIEIPEGKSNELIKDAEDLLDQLAEKWEKKGLSCEALKNGKGRELLILLIQYITIKAS